MTMEQHVKEIENLQSEKTKLEEEKNNALNRYVYFLKLYTRVDA